MSAEVSFDHVRHLYRVGGELIPNVTRMIAALGLIDTSHFTQESRDRGTHVHIAVHYWIQGALDWSSVHEPWKGHVEAAIKFLQDTGTVPSTIQTEIRVYNPTLGYCGTADVFGLILARDRVYDWKSGAIGEATGIQTALYDMAAPLPSGRRRARGGVQLRANGTYRLVDLDELDPTGLDYHRGAALVDIYRRFHWKREKKELLRAA